MVVGEGSLMREEVFACFIFKVCCMEETTRDRMKQKGAEMQVY